MMWMTIRWDSHGAWNDERGTLKEVGLWEHELLMCAAYNVNYGTLYSPDRQGQVNKANEDQRKLLTPGTDALFLHHLPRILDDEGRAHHVHAPNIAKELYGDLAEDKQLSNKGDKVGLCRFYGAIRKAKQEERIWARRQYLLDTAAAKLGYLPRSFNLTDKTLSAQKAAGAAGSGASSSMAQGNREIDKIRAATKNKLAGGLHLAQVMYNDRNKHLQRMILRGATAAEQWHSEQNKALRSVKEGVPWYVKQVSGKMHGHIVDTAKAIFQFEKYERMGLKPVSAFPEEGPALADYPTVWRLRRPRPRASPLFFRFLPPRAPDPRASPSPPTLAAPPV
ncbi:unnamed protein product [Prorocentrum cordatum]|uniref:Uncharacterized protein n=1 Tax=Prorocentrum cordatum TaxID=2364126 RepID=A0ABN9TRM3_9DINO|nr:unnamed protein product [Polarella glacialis]